MAVADHRLQRGVISLGDAFHDALRDESIVVARDHEYRAAHAARVDRHAENRHFAARTAAVWNQTGEDRIALLCGNPVKHQIIGVRARWTEGPGREQGGEILHLL